MTSAFDDTEFIDRDLQRSQAAPTTAPTNVQGAPGPASPARPLNREEIEAKVGETQSRIAELKRAQEELERQRTQLEEAKRRRAEFETGRTEMLENLTRGIGLLDEASFKARRDAEQMAKTLEEFRGALAKIEAIDEKTWTPDTWTNELTRALTTVDNARMEWNTARLKWTLLESEGGAEGSATAAGSVAPNDWLRASSFRELLKLGFALTWPLTLAAILAVVGLVVVLLRTLP